MFEALIEGQLLEDVIADLQAGRMDKAAARIRKLSVSGLKLLEPRLRKALKGADGTSALDLQEILNAVRRQLGSVDPKDWQRPHAKSRVLKYAQQEED